MSLVWTKIDQPKKVTLDNKGFMNFYYANKLMLKCHVNDLTKPLMLEHNFASSAIHIEIDNDHNFNLPHLIDINNYRIELTAAELNKTIDVIGINPFESGNSIDAGFMLPSYLTVYFSMTSDLKILQNLLKSLNLKKFIKSPFHPITKKGEIILYLNCTLKISQSKKIIAIYPKLFGTDDSKFKPIQINFSKVTNRRIFYTHVIFDVLWEHEGIEYKHLVIPAFYLCDRKALEEISFKDTVNTSMSKGIASGIIKGQALNKLPVELRISQRKLIIANFETGNTLFEVNYNDSKLWIIADDNDLTFFRNGDFLICSIDKSCHDNLINNKDFLERQTITINKMAIEENMTIENICVCRHSSEAKYPVVLYPNYGRIFETNIDKKIDYEISSIKDIRVIKKKNYHLVTLNPLVKSEYLVDPRLSIKLVYNALYEKYNTNLEEYSLKSYYKLWAKQFNEYIVYLIFGDVIHANYFINQNNTKEDKKTQIEKIIELYTQMQAIRFKLDYLSLYLPSYLNDYDKKWIEKYLANLMPGKQIIASSFDDFGRFINYIINNLSKYVAEIQRSVAVVERVLRNRNKSWWDKLIDIGPKGLNPWFLAGQARNIAAEIIPFITHEDEEKIKESGPMALNKLNTLNEVFLPPLILETNKHTYGAISNIISRDIKYFQNIKDNKPIKDAMLKRYLKLKAIGFKPLEINGNLSVRDIIENLFSKIKNMDYSSFDSID